MYLLLRIRIFKVAIECNSAVVSHDVRRRYGHHRVASLDRGGVGVTPNEMLVLYDHQHLDQEDHD